jgi:protein associated with RNAse G/E
MTVLVHEAWNGRVWSARPMRLIEESEAGALLWFPRGAHWQAPTTPADRQRESVRAERHATSLLLDSWAFTQREWETDTLQIWPKDAWHSIWVSWKPDGSRWGFYGNIQQPYERTRRGFRTMDLVLDVLVELDGSWRLKDEDELATYVRRGVVDTELERRIRAEADVIVEKLERRGPPFDGSFEDWRPDPDWPTPVLPDDWLLG